MVGREGERGGGWGGAGQHEGKGATESEYSWLLLKDAVHVSLIFWGSLMQ